MLLTETVKIKWNKNQKQKYISKGYNYTKIGDEFEAKIEDVPINNKVTVEVRCDYCGSVYAISYENFNKQRNRCIIKKDACKNCTNKKAEEANLLKYGVRSTFQLEEVKEKIKKSNIKKYGCENPFGNKDIQEKIKQTNLERYGCEIASKSEKVKGKVKQTNLEKYGVYAYTQTDEFKEKTKETIFKRYGCEYYTKTEECKQKIRNTSLKRYGTEHPTMCEEVQNKKKSTNLKKYGVEHVLQNEEIHAKQLETFKHAFKDCTSAQQREICQMVKSEFGNCELNHSFNGYLLDCFTIVNDCKIDIEYDGWYWHKNRLKQDEIRNDKCISSGIKVLRIKGGMKLPDIQELINSINELVNNNNLYYKEIILPDWGE